MICSKLESCVNTTASGKDPIKCDNNVKKCIMSSDQRPEIKCEEKKKKYTLVNTQKNHVVSYRMDGGIISEDASVPEGTNKCDHLFVINSDCRTAILIELKGRDNVSKALKQLHGTLKLYHSFWKTFSAIYARAIVGSSAPNIKATPEYINLAKTIKQTYHGNLKIANQQFKEKDSDLANVKI